MANKPLVIDLYHGDVVTNLQSVAKAGVVGVIHKASEGLHTVDAKYAARRKGFAELGLLWGAYHFFRGDPAEADHFAEAAQPDANTLMAIDWEETSPGKAPSAAAARAFIERLEKHIGRSNTVIYSGNVAKEKISGADPFFGARRLWLAQYASKPTVQRSWKAPWLWQYTETGRISGVSGNVDLNTIVAPMTVDRLHAEWA